ncbi:hypothetical protein ABEB36_014748 [Hypothenemus hampei]|uniref:Uncharacterized protein n=1 Tax=Hypothenemus hampei TaxID=57062 RepID=A0ABD1E3Q4_HYPHA
MEWDQLLILKGLWIHTCSVTSLTDNNSKHTSKIVKQRFIDKKNSSFEMAITISRFKSRKYLGDCGKANKNKKYYKQNSIKYIRKLKMFGKVSARTL